MITQHTGHSARTKHTTGAPHFLLTSDETTFAELELALAALPLCARGRVFVEVPTPDHIGLLAVPPRMTVTWLARSTRSGAPGTAEACRPGTAVSRAARAWAAEMICEAAETDSDSTELARTQVWLGGDYRGVAAIHEYLTETLGLSDDMITTREAYRLGRRAA
ncbi:SIP domain-containing protein [Homoserinimonas sp. OAct 916]|uniref:SIP domain-containing protein n=1 Tax=Homoserinimonas sp. OAct 916 TaxID=2211450 RepID=UPI000DBEA70E|nr:SIP domain-containing protein [Homoserinimonas sp. OAct 916]